MFEFTHPRRIPAAGIDPITTPAAALAVVISAISPMARHETIVLTLDRERRGRTLLVVTGTAEPDTLLGIVDMLADVAIGDADAGGVILASIRPDTGLDADDLDRWEEASEVLGEAGLDLVEWFVLGTSINCPRELGNEPPRW